MYIKAPVVHLPLLAKIITSKQENTQ